MTISERIFTLLDEKKLKQKDFALYLDVSPAVVNAWKKRGTNPPIELAIKICRFLDISIWELLDVQPDTTCEIEDIYNKLSPDDKQIVDFIFDKYKGKEQELLNSKIG